MIDFIKYDTDNPEIWLQFRNFAYQAKYVKRFKNYSAKGIFELIRWHSSIGGNDQFKLNNNYHADYARKMMETDPAFDGFFKVRELKSKRKGAE